MDGQSGAAWSNIKRASRDFSPKSVYRMWGEALSYLHLVHDMDHFTAVSNVHSGGDDVISTSN